MSKFNAFVIHLSNFSWERISRLWGRVGSFGKLSWKTLSTIRLESSLGTLLKSLLPTSLGKLFSQTKLFWGNFLAISLRKLSWNKILERCIGSI